ncbi:MAG: septum formation initiator family protein [Firmicutes bacterium]|nr:septum formation initiator family protein [Bacillota bacterium]
MNEPAYARKLEYMPIREASPQKPIPKTIAIKRWQFKPHSFWPFLTWGFAAFLGVRLIFLPLAEGIYNYTVKTRELNELKIQKQDLEQKLAALTNRRDYMKTTAYIEERAHQIGFIKANEAQVMVIDTQGNPVNHERPYPEFRANN